MSLIRKGPRSLSNVIGVIGNAPLGGDSLWLHDKTNRGAVRKLPDLAGEMSQKAPTLARRHGPEADAGGGFLEDERRMDAEELTGFQHSTL